MADSQNSHNDLDDLRESVFDDLGKFELDSTQRAATTVNSSGSIEERQEKHSVQGLGIGLPSPPSKRKGKQKIGTSSNPISKDADVAETLEKLSQQTRQTLEGLDSAGQEDVAGEKLVENLFKQFEEIGGTQVALVLFETLLLLRYFALLHSGNQAVLRWGKSPTILHKICDLPFAFFSDPQLTPVLVGTLLAVCYGCEQNRNVVQQELSMDMLLVLLKSSKQDISVVSDSRQTIVPRVGIQLDAQSNSISYQSGNMDVIEEESEEEMQKILGKDHGFSSQDVSAKPSEDSPVADIPGSLHQQLSGRSSKTHLVSSDHANNVKRSNRTVNKTVFQGDLSLKESVGTKTNSLGRSVKSKPIGPNKETFTHQAKYSKVSNPDTAQKISSPVSAKRGISVVLPDLKTNSPAGIQLREFKYARDYQDNPLLSPAFMLQNRFPINLIDCAQEFFAAGLE